MTEFDVLIVGAGVAGCAAAMELRSAKLRVGLLHKGLLDLRRVETFSPGAVHHLSRLTIDMGQSIAEVVAWWGSEHAKRAPYSNARVVERSKLAKVLRGRAVEQGATVQEIDSLLSIKKQGDQWCLQCSARESGPHRFATKFLVDATGRGGVVARRLGAKRVVLDQLFAVSVQVMESLIVGTWTESNSRGWWNLSSLAEEGTLSFYSGTATARQAKSDMVAEFERTKHLRNLISTRHFHKPTVSSCGSTSLVPCAGAGWCAIGDAAWTVEPLASAGAAKALRDARLLRVVLEQKWTSYDRFQRVEFSEYHNQLKKHYSTERRWPASLFWSAQLGNKVNQGLAEPTPMNVAIGSA